MARVALVYNLIHPESLGARPLDSVVAGQTYHEFVNEILDHALARRNHNGNH